MGPRTPSPLHSSYSCNDDIDDDDRDGDNDDNGDEDDRDSGTPSPLCSSYSRNDGDVFSVVEYLCANPKKSPQTGLLMTKNSGVHS